MCSIELNKEEIQNLKTILQKLDNLPDLMVISQSNKSGIGISTKINMHINIDDIKFESENDITDYGVW